MTNRNDTTLPEFLIGNILLQICMMKYNMLDALELGFDGYLAKPIVSEKMEQMIMELLPEDLVETGEDLSDEETVKEDFQTEKEADTVSRLSEELPEIDGLDWNHAHIYLPDDSILMMTLKNIYRAMNSDMKQLAELYQNIYNEKGMAEYRIKVHALKSTNASVGAVMVSQLAKLLEQKAIEGDVQSIRQIHPVFMEQMEHLRESLQECFGQGAEEERQAVSVEFLEQKLQELLQALQAYDYDRSDAIAEELKVCDCRPEQKERLQLLCEQEFQLEFEACEHTAIQMLQMIHSERE